MIFLTVGTQLPFDRLVRAVDAWARARGRTDVFGQIADPGPNGFRPTAFPWTANVTPGEFQARCQEATLIVAHAGMGSLISAMTHARPILIMPRQAGLGEHRNDHQLATADRLKDRPGVFVAADEATLAERLDALAAPTAQAGTATLRPFADDRLIATVRAAIMGN